MRCQTCGADLAGRRSDARHCSPRCRAAARRASVRRAVADFAAYVAAHGTAEERAALGALTASPALAEAMGRALLVAEEAAGKGGERL